jgi:uncharacterized membrane protein
MVTVAAYDGLQGATIQRIELAANCSLTPRTAVLFVGSLAIVTLGLAAFLAFHGYWPVLPFAGVEIGLLAWAVRTSMRNGQLREVIEVSEDMVVVRRSSQGTGQNAVFPRHWARVKLRDPPRAPLPSRLVIESHGRACEVGRFLTEEERLGLAKHLQKLVGKTSESPALEP